MNNVFGFRDCKIFPRIFFHFSRSPTVWYNRRIMKPPLRPTQIFAYIHHHSCLFRPLYQPLPAVFRLSCNLLA